MIWRRIFRARKDSTLIIKPILSTYDSDHGSILKQTNEGLVRNFLEFAKDFSCFCDLVFGAADSGMDTARRVLREGGLVGNASISHESHHLCDIATITVSLLGA